MDKPTDERFVYYYPSQIIKDKQTGERHYGNKTIADLLNELNNELEPIKKICEKYRIPLKDLPEILEEYIAYDNDDDWW